jgi:hypothetical protein
MPDLIDVGLIANDGRGDPLRTGAIKINQNFSELYNAVSSTLLNQSGQTGKLLSTNGSNLVWVTQTSVDWNATSGVAQILNKPTLATVATSGSYADLSNKPFIPDNTNDLINGADFATKSYLTWSNITSKPTFADVATSGSYTDLLDQPDLFSGSYNDLTDTPDIPTDVSDLTDDLGLLSGGGGGGGASVTISAVAPAGASQGDLWFNTADSELYIKSFGVWVKTSTTTVDDILPSQTSNGGKYLKTNGSTLSWATVPSDLSDLTDNLGLLTGTGVVITEVVYPYGGSAVNTAGGEVVTLIGAGFAPMCVVYINGEPAAGTTYVSSNEVQFTTTPQSAGAQSLSLVNTSNGSSGIYTLGLLYVTNGYPRFTQAAGSLGTFTSEGLLVTSIGATGGTSPYTFSLVSGYLPTGCTIEESTGVISGTAPSVIHETVYSFTLQVTDSSDPTRSTQSQFYIIVDPINMPNLAKLMFSMSSNYKTAVFADTSATLDFSFGNNYETAIFADASATLDFSFGNNYETAIFADSSKTLDFSFGNNYESAIFASKTKTLTFSIVGDNI